MIEAVPRRKKKNPDYYLTSSYKIGRGRHEPDFLFMGGLFPARLCQFEPLQKKLVNAAAIDVELSKQVSGP